MARFSVNEEGQVVYGYSSEWKNLDQAKEDILFRAHESNAARLAEVPDRQDRLAKAWAMYEKVVDKLTKSLPSVTVDNWSDEFGIHINCRVCDLAVVARVVGKLEVYSKNVKDAKKKLLAIQLRGKENTFVYVTYERKLPKLKKGQAPKCQIKTVVEKRKVLVCEM